MTAAAPTCPTCDRVHCAGDVVAYGKFQPDGPSGYGHAWSGRLFPTRDEAEADLCRVRGQYRIAAGGAA